MSDTAGRRIIPVILCGGAGTRLWPVSRRERPKSLIALVAPETMLQTTALRVCGRVGFQSPVVVTAAAYADAVDAQLDEVGNPPQMTIVEACARGTAAAIALAALNVPADALLLVLPSDHAIADPGAFLAAISAAAPSAADDWLITFGVAPDRPESGYGYIKKSHSIDGEVFKVARFAEKPDQATASLYLEEGGWSWNAGIFLMAAGTFLTELGEHSPETLAAAETAIAGQLRSGRRAFPDGKALASAPTLSVDHAVMEHSKRVAMVPVEMSWSDVGSWDAVHSIGAKDRDDNHLAGDVLAIESKGCLVRSDGPVVVAIGVEDLVIVATDQGILVVPRAESQRVKDALEALEARKDKAAT